MGSDYITISRYCCVYWQTFIIIYWYNITEWIILNLYVLNYETVEEKTSLNSKHSTFFHILINYLHLSFHLPVPYLTPLLANCDKSHWDSELNHVSSLQSADLSNCHDCKHVSSTRCSARHVEQHEGEEVFSVVHTHRHTHGNSGLLYDPVGDFDVYRVSGRMAGRG